MRRSVYLCNSLDFVAGISRVMDLLTESREVIRNDVGIFQTRTAGNDYLAARQLTFVFHLSQALLTLIEITKGNSNIQKIVAFENGFEALFAIMIEEGLCEGGVVVEDCLLLLLQLIKNNTSNQQFFKVCATCL